MKHKFVILIAFVFLGTEVKGQTNETITQYFDQGWNKISTSEGAAYYRTILEKGKTFIVREYFISGKILSLSECSSVAPELFKEGETIIYYENGNVKEKGFYTNNNRTGFFKSYFDTGKPLEEIFYGTKKEQYYHHWSETGEDLLHIGNGIVPEYFSHTSDTYKEIKDSIKISSFSVSNQSRDTIYNIVEQPAEYNGGMPALAKDLKRYLKYPTAARRKGIQGKVYIQFVVNENGAVSNGQILKGFDRDCEEAALFTVSQLHGWTAARHKNKSVKSRFVLPIFFNLKR